MWTRTPRAFRDLAVLRPTLPPTDHDDRAVGLRSLAQEPIELLQLLFGPGRDADPLLAEDRVGRTGLQVAALGQGGHRHAGVGPNGGLPERRPPPISYGGWETRQ